MEMKRFTLAALAAAFALGAFPQGEPSDTGTGGKVRPLRHLDLAFTAGTGGIGIELASPISAVVQLRGGFSFMPRFHADIDFGIESGKYDEAGQWQATNIQRLSERMEELTGWKIDDKISMNSGPTFWNFDVLVDVFPFHRKNWHFTGGIYWGRSKIATSYNTTLDMVSLLSVSAYNFIYDKIINGEPIYDDVYLDPEIEDRFLEYGRLGMHLGEWASDGTSYVMEPDADGMVKAKVKVNNIKPYLGFGYGGRLIRGNDNINVSFDAGILFWGGTPQILTHDGVNLAKDIDNVRGKVGTYVDIISAFKVYPILNFRISRRLY